MGLSSLFRWFWGGTDAAIVVDEPQIRRNEGHRLTVGGATIVVCQAQHLGMRRQQQDAFGFSEPAASPFVAVVADGMGGMRNGAEASRLALREFLTAMAEGRDPVASVRRANEAVYHLGVEAGDPEGTGSTLAAVWLMDGAFGWICVGDSQIYRFRNGELALVNEEHSWFADLLDRVADGSMTLDQARSDPQKDALTSFIGREELHRIDRSRSPVPVAPGDRIMICSDGLYRVVGEEEIRGILSVDDDNPADRLLRLAMSKQHPHQDNTTVITLSIENLS